MQRHQLEYLIRAAAAITKNGWRLPCWNALTNAPIEDRFERSVVAGHGIHIGPHPFIWLCRPPTDFAPCVDDDMFKKNALGTTIPLAKRVDHIEIAEQVRNALYQFRPFAGVKPLVVTQALKEFCGLGCHALNIAKAGRTLGNVHTAQFTGPFVNIGEQSPMNALQGAEIVRRGREVDFVGRDARKIPFGLAQQRIVKQAETIFQRGRAWVAVRVLPGAALVRDQVCAC
jgi:hypothetical protein